MSLLGSIPDRKRCGSIPHKKSSDIRPGHSRRILSIAVSTDNKFLVSNFKALYLNHIFLLIVHGVG